MSGKAVMRQAMTEARLWGLSIKGERKNPDNRDQLPYTLTCIGPPEKRLGTFKLDPLTHCGDTLYVNDRKYVVKKVSFCYKLDNGRYKMVSKAALCKEKARITAEEALKRMWEQGSVAGIEDDIDYDDN